MIKSNVFWALILAAFSVVSTARADAKPRDQAHPQTMRETPRRTVEEFLRAAHDGNYELAATYLDLRGFSEAERASEGPKLARELKLVFDQQIWLEPDQLSDDPAGDQTDGANVEALGTIRGDAHTIAIQLRRVTSATGESSWLFSSRTVNAIPSLYDQFGPGILGERIPHFLTRTSYFGVELWQWIGLLVFFMLSWIVSQLFGGLVLRTALRISASGIDQLAVRFDEHFRKPSRLLLLLAVDAALVESLHLPTSAGAIYGSILRGFLVLGFGGIAFGVVNLVSDNIADRASSGTTSSHDRGVITQVTVLRRVLHFVVFVVGAALVLVQFQAVRNFGMSLLASAGVAGLVAGFAAQQSLSTLFAGVQLSMSRTLRIGDTVIVESEFGEVESITLSNVVIKTWDRRRLVVPINYFLQKPFQNWTLKNDGLIGTVDLFCDYTVPAELVRTEFLSFVEKHPKWKGDYAVMQVREVSDRALTLRCLASAKNPDDVTDLRADVREHMLRYLQDLEKGKYLPKNRVTNNESAS